MTSLPNYGLLGLDSKSLLDSLAVVPVANRQALLSSSLGSLQGGQRCKSVRCCITAAMNWVQPLHPRFESSTIC
jgi:hypothetical protein